MMKFHSKFHVLEFPTSRKMDKVHIKVQYLGIIKLLLLSLSQSAGMIEYFGIWV